MNMTETSQARRDLAAKVVMVLLLRNHPLLLTPKATTRRINVHEREPNVS